jgi:hypothetical protein
MKIKSRLKRDGHGGVIIRFEYEVKFRNPCKNCLVVAACRTHCENKYNYDTPRDKMIVGIVSLITILIIAFVGSVL